MSKIELKTNLIKLASMRANYEAVKAVRDIKLAAFKEAHANIFEAVDATAEQVKEREAQVRAEAVEIYNDYGDKTPVDGIEIKVSHVRTYNYDPATALNWAKKKELCLLLDKKGFEDVCANDSLRPEFVEVCESDEPKPFISSKLTEIYAIEMSGENPFDGAEG